MKISVITDEFYLIRNTFVIRIKQHGPDSIREYAYYIRVSGKKIKVLCQKSRKTITTEIPFLLFTPKKEE